MHFQQPNMLWGLLFLAIPLLIHLFQFQRTQTVYFPGVFRLIQRLQQARHQKKVQHWIVLIARMLAFSCLVFAFAMPTCNSNSKNQEFSHVVVLFDNSYSMSTKNADGVLIEQARNQARKMVQGLNQEIQVRVLTQDPLANYGWMSPAQALSIIDTLALCPQQRSWMDWMTQVDEMVHEGGMASMKVMAFGDGQLSMFSNKSKLIQAPNVHWEFVLYSLDPSQNSGNLGIDTVWYESVWQNTEATSNVVLKTRIRNYSQSLKETTLRYISNNKTTHVKAVKLAAGAALEVEIPLSEMELSTSSSLNLDDDGFVYDNVKYLHPVKKIQTKVGVMGSDDAIAALFASQPLLKQQPVDRSELRLEGSEILGSLDALILINDAVYSAQELSTLRDMMSRGKVVLQFFSDPIRGNSRDLGFGELKCEWKDAPASLNRGGSNSGYTDPSGFNASDRLAAGGFQHPIFQQAFGEALSEKTELPIVGGHLIWKSTLDFETVLQLESGDPVLLKRNEGGGSHWVWMSDLRGGSKELKASAWFLPIFTQIIASAAVNEQPLYGELFSGRLLPLPGPVQVDERAAKLRGSLGNIVVDLQSNVGQHTSMYVGAQPQQSGYFWLIGSNQKDSVEIALNLDRRESDLRSFSQWETLNFQQDNPMLLVNGDGISPIIHNNPLNSPWRLFIWGAAFFFALEVFIILLQNKNRSTEPIKP